MPDEENPFMIKPKPAQKEPERTLSFGTEEVVSFMVNPGEVKEKDNKLFDDKQKPHWERSGTPLWDKKDADLNNPDYEVVDHDETD
ncbi:MAG: hypothetical protein ACMUHY_06760 [Thermoplasmatota archaeon]